MAADRGVKGKLRYERQRVVRSIENCQELVIAGNHCFVDTHGEAPFEFSELDYGMLSPFVQAWNGPVTILPLRTPSNGRRAVIFDDTVSIEPLVRSLFSYGVRRLIATPVIVFRMVRKLKRGDAVAYGRLPSPMGALLLLLSWAMRRPAVASIHGYPRWERRPRTGPAYRWYTRVARKVYGRILRHCKICFVTDHDALLAFGGHTENAAPLYTTLIDAPPAGREAVLTRGEPLRLGFVGRLEHDKNPLFFVEVAQKIRESGVEVVLEVVGKGSLDSALAKMAGAADLPVLRHGWIDSRDRLMEVVQSFDFVIIPSRTEGNPKVLIESMAVGVPAAIFPLNKRVRELGRSGGVIYVDSFDAPAWAAAILQSAEPERYAALSQAGRAAASQYTVPNLVRNLRHHFARSGVVK